MMRAHTYTNTQHILHKYTTHIDLKKTTWIIDYLRSLPSKRHVKITPTMNKRHVKTTPKIEQMACQDHCHPGMSRSPVTFWVLEKNVDHDFNRVPG